jgi:CheY-like chemotaxis protein
MRKKLNCIMLIDDNEDDNFIHQIVLKRADASHKIQIAESGMEALEYLKKGKDIPELIFLDINMPRMNGWEFLEEYKLLDKDQKAEVVVIMLSTSVNPADREKAISIEEVRGFKSKPLSREMLDEVLDRFFSD